MTVGINKRCKIKTFCQPIWKNRTKEKNTVGITMNARMNINLFSSSSFISLYSPVDSFIIRYSQYGTSSLAHYSGTITIRLLNFFGWNADRKGGPFSRFTVDVDGAVMLFDDIVGDVHTQAGAFADILCGEKRVENPGNMFRIDPATGIADFDLYGIILLLCYDVDVALFLYGLCRIDQDIHKYLV